MVAVNDLYPPDCMTYGFLIDPHQAKYRLKGYEVKPAARTTPNVVPDPDTSLQLKPDTRANLEQQTTPARTDDSNPSSSCIVQHQEPGNDKSTGKGGVISSPNQQDALDEAIQEARVVHHLVSEIRMYSGPANFQSAS